MFDPMVSLATALHAQPGVYALLLGSGVSTGAGVPTGWGVVTELVRRAAQAAGDAPGEGFNPEDWWAANGDGQPLGYSQLLSALAPTPAARRALLAGFFEPTEDDREDGRKVPSAAHHAVAALVRRGTIRVIVTTNFDRLLEQALEGVGIMPQVIATPAAVGGMEPLAHARCTVIKLHGDYATLDQLNTVEELSTYSDEMAGLLERVLDEYGLVVSGWSADWDHALVEALYGTRSRRYPLYWASYGALGNAASRLVAQHRATVVEGATADAFFPDAVARLEALDSLASAPVTLSVAIAQLKRALPDPTRHIQVADLIEVQLSRVRDEIRAGSAGPSNLESDAIEEAHQRLVRSSDVLLHLLAHGVHFDRDQQHTDLWVSTIQRLMRMRQQPRGTYQPVFESLAHLPALLALRVAVIAALEAQREQVAVRLLREPTWRSPFMGGEETSAATALHDFRVLDRNVVNDFPIWNTTKWRFPQSHYIKTVLGPIIVPLLGDDESYIRAFHRAEYRTGLAQHLDPGPDNYKAAPGEFVGDGQWRGRELIWEVDFRQTADRHAWDWTPVADGVPDQFSDELTSMTETLKRMRYMG